MRDALDRMRTQLAEFEARYDMPREGMTEAQALHDPDGALVETEDLMDRSSLFERIRTRSDRPATASFPDSAGDDEFMRAHRFPGHQT